MCAHVHVCASMCVQVLTCFSKKQCSMPDSIIGQPENNKYMSVSVESMKHAEKKNANK